MEISFRDFNDLTLIIKEKFLDMVKVGDIKARLINVLCMQDINNQLENNNKKISLYFLGRKLKNDEEIFYADS